MKLLLFSDLHADVSAAQELAKQAEHADVLVGAGDFGNARRNVSRCIEILQRIDRPAILVAGNNESTEELCEACLNWPRAHVLHGTGRQMEGVEFFGLGGGVPVTPFGPWSYDFTEEQAAELLSDCPTGGVLVSHSPPRNLVDRSSRGQHLGSTAVRRTILEKKPRLVVCGHIHESAGQHATLDQSTVVNAGPAGILWDLW